MHEAVTHSSVFKSNTIPINLKGSNVTTTETNTAFSWPEIYDPDSDKLLDNYLSANNYISPLSVTLEQLPRFTKLPPDLSSYLPTMNDNHNNRWHYNTKTQQNDPTWMMADEIARMNLGDVGGDSSNSPRRTPPKHNAAGPIGDRKTSPNGSPSGQGGHHSRGSSIDKSPADPSIPVGGNNALHPSSVKGSPISELKERPHSFSGGLSTADLRKLQTAGDESSDQPDLLQQQWASAHPRDGSSNGEQLPYPSLSNNAAPIVRNGAPPFDGRGPPGNVPFGEDFVYPRGMQAHGNLAAAQMQGLQDRGVYRQPIRNFQGALPSPTGMAFPVMQQPSTLPLGNPQQVYDMMLPGAGPEGLNPAALNRLQQQNAFRGNHHHSSSDPSAIRDAAALALLNGSVQFGPMFPAMATPPALYGQFYGQDAYNRPSSTAAAVVAQAMAARLQSQYTAGYGMVNSPADQALASPTASSVGQNGPSANNRKLGLYKTELCRSWEEKGTCRYGTKCQFAHGEDELRKVARHPKYKTEICRTFWVSGSCPYGKRCCFIHTELPSSGGAGAAPSATTENGSSSGHARTRSLSTNSDPNDASVSLLTRISKRNQDSPSQNSSPAPGESQPFQNQRPPTGSLRVDTALDGASMKQNKSAYPTFASNGVLLHNLKSKSPVPLTAGPDLGRHNASRLEIVGYNNQRIAKSTTPPGQNNSYNEDVSFSPSPPIPGESYTLSGDGSSNTTPPRANGHVRAGSAGNWASLTRGSHLSSSSFPSPGGDGTITSPWSTTELAPVGASRLNDKTWG